MKRINSIVVSSTAPINTDVLWINDGVIKCFNGGWKDLSTHAGNTNIHVPVPTKPGQILVSGSDNNPVWADYDKIMLDSLTYGVRFYTDVASPVLTRVGNMQMHRDCPITSLFSGCIEKDGDVQYYLAPENWAYKKGFAPSDVSAGRAASTVASVLDGTDGNIMIDTMRPCYYRSFIVDSRTREVRFSQERIDNSWIEFPRMLIDFTNTCIDRDTDKACCVVNTSARYRGGDNSSSYDSYLSSDPARSLLGKSVTSKTRAQFREMCSNAGGGRVPMCYDIYKVLYWLYVCEYANFNCQAEFESALDSNGFHQGGLGKGLTDISDWEGFNSYNPVCPVGHTNSIGNGTGIKALSIENHTGYSSRWRGFENLFGNISNILDGIIIAPYKDSEDSAYYHARVWTTDDPKLFSDSDYSRYRLAGIELRQGGYIKTFDLGNTAEIIPDANQSGSTSYKCDRHYTDSDNSSLKLLLVGGFAYSGAGAGFGWFSSVDGVGLSRRNCGFLSVIIK